MILNCRWNTAHQDAFNKANLLHQNISVRNILIKEDGGGMLIDWDLSVNASHPGGILVRRKKRTVSDEN